MGRPFELIRHYSDFKKFVAPCGLRGWMNWPASFPGRMSQKAT